MESTQQVTAMLREWGEGSAEALDRLIPLVYDELRKQAARFLRRERSGHTLQTTELIHETYLKLIDQHRASWVDRTHFFAISARLMRRILIDHARAKHRNKRGGADALQITLDESVLAESSEQNMDLVALDEALEKLSGIDEQQVRVVELRYFAGLSLEDTAAALSISRTSVVTEWRMARAWLRRELAV